MQKTPNIRWSPKKYYFTTNTIKESFIDLCIYKSNFFLAEFESWIILMFAYTVLFESSECNNKI